MWMTTPLGLDPSTRNHDGKEGGGRNDVSCAVNMLGLKGGRGLYGCWHHIGVMLYDFYIRKDSLSLGCQIQHQLGGHLRFFLLLGPVGEKGIGVKEETIDSRKDVDMM